MESQVKEENLYLKFKSFKNFRVRNFGHIIEFPPVQNVLLEDTQVRDPYTMCL